jgi:nitroreductase
MNHFLALRILTEFSSRPNPRYIYMSSFISSSPLQNTKQFLQIQSLALGIARRSLGAVPTPATTPASNYSQFVHRLWNPRVPLRSSCRGLHRSAFGLSIGSPNLRQSMDFSSAPARVFFPVRNLHCCT